MMKTMKTKSMNNIKENNMETKKGKLIIVSAPSGCGKGTMLKEILKDNRYYYSVSSTTRKPREEDIEGVTYNFLTKEQFEEKIKENEWLEYTEYCNNYYGTPKSVTFRKLDEGKDVILEIEVEGAENIKKAYPEAVSIFILPPSIQELERRLRKRGSEQEDVIEKRVERAKYEISQSEKYDYRVVNGELEKAIDDFRSIIESL